jgi:hypothetical protein
MEQFKLSTGQRVNRVLLGSVLIVATMLAGPAPLGAIALLPLLATYPIFAGIFGYDPLSRIPDIVFQRSIQTVHHPRPGHSH